MNDRNRDRTVIPAQLRAFGAQPTRAVMTVAELTPASRLGRAAAGLAACWSLALVAVFLPILHLVLVPTLVVGGIVAAITLGRQARRVTDLRGPCPRCATEQRFEASGRLRPTRLTTCPKCHTNVTLVVGDGAASETTPVEVGDGHDHRALGRPGRRPDRRDA